MLAGKATEMVLWRPDFFGLESQGLNGISVMDSCEPVGVGGWEHGRRGENVHTMDDDVMFF